MNGWMVGILIGLALIVGGTVGAAAVAWYMGKAFERF